MKNNNLENSFGGQRGTINEYKNLITELEDPKSPKEARSFSLKERQRKEKQIEGLKEQMIEDLMKKYENGQKVKKYNQLKEKYDNPNPKKDKGITVEERQRDEEKMKQLRIEFVESLFKKHGDKQEKQEYNRLKEKYDNPNPKKDKGITVEERQRDEEKMEEARTNFVINSAENIFQQENQEVKEVEEKIDSKKKLKDKINIQAEQAKQRGQERLKMVKKKPGAKDEDKKEVQEVVSEADKKIDKASSEAKGEKVIEKQEFKKDDFEQEFKEILSDYKEGADGREIMLDNLLKKIEQYGGKEDLKIKGKILEELDEINKSKEVVNLEDISKEEVVNLNDLSVDEIDLKRELIPKRFEREIGIKPEDLEKIEGFSKLSTAQQLLVLENLKQFNFGRIVSESKQEQQKVTNESKWYGKIWQGITKNYQVRKLEKQKAEEIERGGIEKHGDKIKQLVDGILNFGPEVKEKNGKLELQFVSGLENLNQEEQKIVDNFNDIANQFARIPDEWKYEGASRKEKKQYKELKEAYEEARRKLLILKKEKAGEEEAFISTNEEEKQIKLNQILNENPQLEKELRNIKNVSALRGALKDIVTERGLYMGAGFVARGVTKSMLGVFGLPFASAGIGYWRGRNRAKEGFNDMDKTGRKGKTDELSEEEKKMRAKKYYIDGEKEGEKEFVDATYISESLDFLTNQLEELNSKDELNDQEESRKEEIIKSLKFHIEDSGNKLENGEINFGDQENRISNQYNLMQSLAMAQSFVSSHKIFKDKEVQKKYAEDKKQIDEYLDQLTGDITKERKEEIRKKALKGAGYAAGFTIAGSAFRWAGEELGWWGKEATQGAVQEVTQEAVKGLNQEQQRVFDEAWQWMQSHDHDDAFNKEELEQFVKDHSYMINNREDKFFEALEDKIDQNEVAQEINENVKILDKDSGGLKEDYLNKKYESAIGSENMDTRILDKSEHFNFKDSNIDTDNTVQNVEMEVPNEAIIKRGEGIEHALIRQLKANPEKFGYEGDPAKSGEVAKWAGKEAHKLAVNSSYVNAETGAEVRVGTKGVDKVAYVLKTNSNGELEIEEHFKNGNGEFELKESHKSGDLFEQSKDREKYEYEYKKPQVEDIEDIKVKNLNNEELGKLGIDVRNETDKALASYLDQHPDLLQNDVITSSLSVQEIQDKADFGKISSAAVNEVPVFEAGDVNSENPELVEKIKDLCRDTGSGPSQIAKEILNLSKDTGASPDKVLDNFKQLFVFSGEKRQAVFNLLNDNNIRESLASVFNTTISPDKFSYEDGLYRIKDFKEGYDLFLSKGSDQIKFSLDGPGENNLGDNSTLGVSPNLNLNPNNIEKANNWLNDNLGNTEDNTGVESNETVGKSSIEEMSPGSPKSEPRVEVGSQEGLEVGGNKAVEEVSSEKGKIPEILGSESEKILGEKSFENWNEFEKYLKTQDYYKELSERDKAILKVDLNDLNNNEDVVSSEGQMSQIIEKAKHYKGFTDIFKGRGNFDEKMGNLFKFMEKENLSNLSFAQYLQKKVFEGVADVKAEQIERSLDLIKSSNGSQEKIDLARKTLADTVKFL